MSYLNTEEYKFEHKTIYIIKHTYNAIFITLKACKKKTLKIAGASNYFVRK